MVLIQLENPYLHIKQFNTLIYPQLVNISNRINDYIMRITGHSFAPLEFDTITPSLVQILDKIRININKIQKDEDHPNWIYEVLNLISDLLIRINNITLKIENLIKQNEEKIEPIITVTEVLSYFIDELKIYLRIKDTLFNLDKALSDIKEEHQNNRKNLEES